jgi:hypothetical protein
VIGVLRCVAGDYELEHLLEHATLSQQQHVNLLRSSATRDTLARSIEARLTMEPGAAQNFQLCALRLDDASVAYRADAAANSEPCCPLSAL